MSTELKSARFDNDLQEIVSRLVEAYSPLRIYLFGSKARGDDNADSDYDLMIIVPDDATKEQRDVKLACKALKGKSVALDALVWTYSAFYRRSYVIASLPATVLREGILIYESNNQKGEFPMPDENEIILEIRAWLEKANKDIRGSIALLSANPPIIENALFHCQQAVEKSFKAFLTWHSQPFKKTHDLWEIGVQCLKYDQSLKGLIELAVPLSEYAWKFRYPGNYETPPYTETERAIQVAKEVYDAILSRLPEEVRP